MQFQIAQRSKTFKAPVRIPEIDENGRQKYHAPFKMEFLRLTRSEFDAVIASGKDAEADTYFDDETVVSSEKDKLGELANMLMKFAIGWDLGKDGKPLDFTKENVCLLMEVYPEANSAIINTYVAAIFNGGLQKKN